MESQVVEIESEKYGIFEVEAPTNWSSEDIKSHVEGLDLDLMLGIGGETDIGETNVEKIKEWENSVGAGKRDDKWFPHASLEGGTDTVAYGHKLTSEEAESGVIKLGDREVNWRQGLSEEDAMVLLNQDAGWAKKVAMSSLRKANMADDDNKVQALTSLIYNVGSGAWGKSKAKKYLEAGNVEDFMHEAFDKEIGFVKINGDISRGLQRRRAAEASLFAQGNIEQGDSVMSQILDAINPISTAQAATLSPETRMEPAKGKLGGLDVPMKPKQTGELGNLNVPMKPSGEGEVRTTTDKIGTFFSNLLVSETEASEPSPEVKEVKQRPLPTVNPQPTKEEETLWDAITSVPVVAKAIKYYDMFTSTPASAGVADVLHQQLDFIPGERVFTEKTMSEGGLNFLKDFAMKNIPKGQHILTYQNTGGEGVKAVGHQAGLPDFSKPDAEVKFFLGKAQYIREGDTVYVADEYDYNYALDLRDQSLWTKFGQIYDRVQEYQEGKVGQFAIVDSILERFQSKPGEGPSVRIKVGTKEELKLDDKSFNNLPTLADYVKKNKSINPRNINWKPE